MMPVHCMSVSVDASVAIGIHLRIPRVSTVISLLRIPSRTIMSNLGHMWLPMRLIIAHRRTLHSTTLSSISLTPDPTPIPLIQRLLHPRTMSTRHTPTRPMSRQLIPGLHIIGLLLHGGLSARITLALNRRNQINKETEYVECENESNGPFKDRSCVVGLLLCDAEGDCQGDLDDDEKEFDPEGTPQYSVFAEVYNWLLVS